MLVSMLFFDILDLTCRLIRSLEHFIPVPNKDISLYYTIADTIGRFSLTGSILMMVTIGHVRYSVIRTPLHQRILVSSSNKRLQQLLKHLIPTIMVSLASTSLLILEIFGPSELRLNPLHCFFVLGIWNFVLLGMFPCASLIYFAYEIRFYTNERHLENIHASYDVRNMHAATEKVTNSLVMIIIVFIVLQFPLIVGSVAEYYVLTMPNRDEKTLEFGFGIPMWLRILGSINELCTALNACLNIIIYRYLNSPHLFCLNPNFSCLQGTAGIPSLLPLVNINYVNTPVREHQSNHLSGNAMKIDDVGTLSIVTQNQAYNPKEYDESSSLPNCVINVDGVTEIITYQVRRKGHDYI